MSKIAVQLEFVLDAEAEPVDLDQSVARFLLAFVRSSATAEISLVEDTNQPKNDISRNHPTGAADVKIQGMDND